MVIVLDCPIMVKGQISMGGGGKAKSPPCLLALHPFITVGCFFSKNYQGS